MSALHPIQNLIPTVEEAIALLRWKITPERFREVFRLSENALISFSGGRTSAFMLWCVLVAHDGVLPNRVVVAFANTGKEREETLRFVHEITARWGCYITWVEWRDNIEGFQQVSFNGASRHGEPFDALIKKKSALPSGKGRWCTMFLKVLPIFAVMRAFGRGEPGDYLELIGLRHDEGLRILSGLARAEKDGRRISYPLDKAHFTKRDVRAFWWGDGRRYETSTKPQRFDLELPDLWGNCDLCFAMGVGIREERIRQDPNVAPWWIGAEVSTGNTFSSRESVADIVRRANAYDATPDLFTTLEADSDSACGDWCPGEDE